MKLTDRHHNSGRCIGGEGMVSRCHASSNLQINLGFGIRCPLDPLKNVLGPFTARVGLRKVESLRAPFETGEMSLEFKRTPAVRANDFVDSVAELKSSIFDRNGGLGERHELSVDAGDIRHVTSSFGTNG